MILSQVLIDWRHARNPYDIHCALWRLFPGQAREGRTNGEEARIGFLFRIEENQPGRGATIMMQSENPPQTGSEGAKVVRLSNPFEPSLKPGDRLRFLLTANPIKTITDADGRTNAKGEVKKCRVPLIHEEEQRVWLARKLNGAAELETLELRTERPLYFRKKVTGKIVSVTFEGILRVTDGTAFVSLLKNGIGPAKAFGCGLMLVKRL
jgi:CRISPR system Cascade subunit CasE